MGCLGPRAFRSRCKPDLGRIRESLSRQSLGLSTLVSVGQRIEHTADISGDSLDVFRRTASGVGRLLDVRNGAAEFVADGHKRRTGEASLYLNQELFQPVLPIPITSSQGPLLGQNRTQIQQVGRIC
jgi:hypothetical protein